MNKLEEKELKKLLRELKACRKGIDKQIERIDEKLNPPEPEEENEEEVVEEEEEVIEMSPEEYEETEEEEEETDEEEEVVKVVEKRAISKRGVPPKRGRG
jgi:hypothetical protein